MNARIFPFALVVPLTLFVALTSGRNLTAAELRVGQATAPPGAMVSVPVSVGGVSGAVAAQFEVSFNPSFVSLAGISAGAGLAGHIVDQQQLVPGQWRALVYSATNATITAGSIVWLNFSIPTNSPDGVVPLALTNTIVARVAGQRVQPLSQSDGALLVSSAGSFLSMTIQNGNQLQMQFQGVEGQPYVFEASTNLTNWVALSTNTAAGGIISLLETNTLAFPHRFYRAKRLP